MPAPLAGLELLVLDLDDTLFLERDYVRSGFAAAGAWARAELGVPDLAERAWAAFEAGARRTVFDEVLRACGVRADAGLVRRLVDVYRTHAPALALLPDARALLDAAAARGLALAGVTDGPAASQRAKARALGLERWLAPLLFTAELGEGLGKPHPHAFALAQQAHGVAAARCAYVADNPAKDFRAPHALGWRTVRVRRAGGLHAGVPSGPDVLREVEDLWALLPLAPGRRERAGSDG